MREDLEKVLFHESTILARLDQLAEEITRDYLGKDLTALVILQGGMILMADLLRRVQIPLLIETLSASSYHGTTQSSGKVLLPEHPPDLRGRHVLLLDDILDTGLTLATVKAEILARCGAAGVKTCVLLRKRKDRAVEVEADYVGFDIGDDFVVGYGLDFQGRYRNLPFIGVLREDVIAKTLAG